MLYIRIEPDKVKEEIRSIFLILRKISRWNKVVESYAGKDFYSFRDIFVLN